MRERLESIYTRHADFVWRTLLRLGIDRVDTSDAMQDVFLIVHEQLAHFEGRCAMTTWLFTICRSVATRRRKRGQRERDHVCASEVDDVIDLHADVDRAVEHHRDLELLQSLLAALDSDQRNVFILFELERMTGEDIAGALAIPLGTVYSRLQLARSAFRQALARHQAQSRLPGLHAGGGGA